MLDNSYVSLHLRMENEKLTQLNDNMEEKISQLTQELDDQIREKTKVQQVLADTSNAIKMALRVSTLVS